MAWQPVARATGCAVPAELAGRAKFQHRPPIRRAGCYIDRCLPPMSSVRLHDVSELSVRLHERSTDVAVTVRRPLGGPLRRRGEPVRLGIPLPKGVCRDERAIGLDGPWGPMALQARTLDRWPDGSARWVLL